MRYTVTVVEEVRHTFEIHPRKQMNDGELERYAREKFLKTRKRNSAVVDRQFTIVREEAP